MMDDNKFQTLDASSLHADLWPLLERVAREKGRAEIANCDGGDCVIISKEELDTLEKALAILSNTEGGRKIHRSVRQFVKMDFGEDRVPCVAVAGR
jgi:PHD/YefM family antitoxin component YafN of YafNO toxin-antitoxin module